MSILTDSPRGEITRTFVETGAWRGGVKLRLPLIVVRGVEPGPTLAVSAAQHGREVAGIAAIERALGQIDPTALRGTLALLPVMNPLAVRMRRQDYPFEHGRYARSVEINLNRHWNGTGNYPLWSAVAEAVKREVLSEADALVDIHGWSPGTVGMAWAPTEQLDLLKATGFEFIRDQGPIEKLDRPELLGNWFRMQGKPAVTFELGTQNIFAEHHIERGRRLIANVARHLGLLDSPPEWPEAQYLFGPASDNVRTTAAHEGLVVFDVPKGAFVTAGRRVYRVVSLETLETLETVTAPMDAVVVFQHTVPAENMPISALCEPGELVCEMTAPVETVRRG